MNTRKFSDVIELIGGDVAFCRDAFFQPNSDFRARRCNYPFIATYVRAASEWKLYTWCNCQGMVTLLARLNPDEDYFFIGTRDIDNLPAKINYG